MAVSHCGYTWVQRLQRYKNEALMSFFSFSLVPSTITLGLTYVKWSSTIFSAPKLIPVFSSSLRLVLRITSQRHQLLLKWALFLATSESLTLIISLNSHLRPILLLNNAVHNQVHIARYSSSLWKHCRISSSNWGVFRVRCGS